MQSNLESFFRVRHDSHDSGMPITPPIPPSRTVLKNLLSGKQNYSVPKTLPVTLKISRDKLKSLQDSKISPRDLFSRTSTVKRKLVVSFKYRKLDPITVESDDDERVSIRDILNNDVEIVAESKPIFKSKISASDVLQNFKQRQLLKRVDEEDVKEMNSNSFFQDVAERAAVSKLMKEKGVAKVMLLPVLRSGDFHIYERDDIVEKLPLVVKEPVLVDFDMDDRFGPLNETQVVSPVKYTTTESVTDLMEMIKLRILDDPALYELYKLSQTDEFKSNCKLNNSLLCDLFKPNINSLLIPTQETARLRHWFQDQFSKLPKKKPNRHHLFKKTQDEVSEFDSFIVNDEDDDVEKDQELPIVVIIGDHGVGKTAVCEAILKEFNAYIYDLDSSVLDKKELREMVIHQKYDNHIKQDSCVILDEIPLDDDTFFQILRGVLLCSRKPIVLTISEEDYKKLPHWLAQVETFEFAKCGEQELVLYLSVMALIFGVDVDDAVLKKLVLDCDYDLRKCINEMQLLLSGMKQTENITQLKFNEIDKKCESHTATSIEALAKEYHKLSLLDTETDDELDRIKSHNRQRIYQNTVSYFNSKNSTKFSRRHNYINTAQEMNSIIYNNDSQRNWTLFRLEFFETLLEMSKVDCRRDVYYRKFHDDPLKFLQTI